MRNRRDRPSTAVAVAVVLGFALLAAATGPAVAVSGAAGQGPESGHATDRRAWGESGRTGGSGDLTTDGTDRGIAADATDRPLAADATDRRLATGRPAVARTNGSTVSSTNGSTTATATTATATPDGGTTGDGNGTRPAVALSNLSSPDRVRRGEAFVVAATATNRGADGTAGVTYSFDGAPVVSRNVTLAAGASTRVRFRTSIAEIEAAHGPVEVATYAHGVRNASGGGVDRPVRVTPDVDVAVGSFDAPTEATREEPFLVLATVENPANVSVTRTVAYEFAGAVVAEKPVTVGADSRQQVAFEASVAAAEAVAGPLRNGTTYDHAVVAPGGASDGGAIRVVRGPSADPATLAVERFDAPGDVRRGDTVRVNVTLRNVGTVPFEGQLAYRLDGSAVATEAVAIPIGERRTVRFRVPYETIDRAAVPLSARRTTHGVWVVGEAIETTPVTVHAPVETPTPTPRPTATPTPPSTPTPTPVPTPTRTSTPAVEPGGGTDADCRRGFFAPCTGSPVDQTTLTLIGIFTSILGIVYEMLQG